MTRPVGSVNSKNGKKVICLRQGTPVTEGEIMSLFDDMRYRPSSTLMKIWFGGEKVSPCPLCRSEGSYLEVVSPETATCYGPCGKVGINGLFQAVLTTATKGKR